VGKISGPNPILGLPLYVSGGLLFGAPVIGLSLLVAMSRDLVATSDWGDAVFYVFLVSAGMPVFTVLAWVQGGRRRGWASLVQTGVTGVAALLSYLMLRFDTVALDSGWVVLLTLTATATGFGALIVLVVGSRSWRRHTPRRLRPRTPTDVGYNGLRAQVLEILKKRGIVDEKDVDVPAMLEMPIGSWRELDG
jgi:hypothetical protein